MSSNTKRIVYVATHHELQCRSYYSRLWIVVKNIKISRRLWLNEMANTFRDFKGHILWKNGMPYKIPCVDDTFGNDPDLRWMGYYLRSDNSGFYPQSLSRKVDRLRLLDLYFRIKYPYIARHFTK